MYFIYMNSLKKRVFLIKSPHKSLHKGEQTMKNKYLSTSLGLYMNYFVHGMALIIIAQNKILIFYLKNGIQIWLVLPALYLPLGLVNY